MLSGEIALKNDHYYYYSSLLVPEKEMDPSCSFLGLIRSAPIIVEEHLNIYKRNTPAMNVVILNAWQINVLSFN